MSSLSKSCDDSMTDSVVWSSVSSSDRTTYLEHLKFLDIDSKRIKKKGERIDPRKDVVECLRKIFDNIKTAKAFECGMIKYVVESLKPIESNLSWKGSSLLHLYITYCRERIILLQKYPQLVKFLNKMPLNKVELEARKKSYDFASMAWTKIASRLASQQAKLDYRKTTDLIKCPKCGARKTEIKLKQTRSADEPETMFIHCVNCGYRWKQSAA